MSSDNKNSHYELRKLMHKYDTADGDISFYLVLFERQARRVELEKKHWVSHLLGLLPYEITQLIAREKEENANNYSHVKELLLRRYKLSSEQFRQKFMDHTRAPQSTWKDYAFELQNYFEEWIAGLGITEFNSLKELIVADQIKKRVPTAIREHFIDELPKLVNPEKLAEKLDEYESVRIGMKTPHMINKNPKYGGGHKIICNYDKPYAYENDRRATNFRNNMNYSYDNNYQKRNSFPRDGANKNSFRPQNQTFRQRAAERGNFSPRFPPCAKREIMLNNVSRKTEVLESNCKTIPRAFTRSFKNRENRSQNYFSKSDDQNKIKCGEYFDSQSIDNGVSKNIKHAEIVSEENLLVQGLDFKGPSTYLKNAKINDTILTTIFDTGSSTCLLKLSVARRLKLPITLEQNELFGIGNQSKAAAVTIGKTTADIEIDGIIGQNITILVVEDCTLPVDLIVGRTWCDLPYIVYAKIGNQLHLKYADDSLFGIFEQEKSVEKFELKATSDVIVESSSVNYVKAKCEKLDDGLLMIDGTEDELGTLLEVRGGETVVPITNLRGEKIVLKKNQCVARAETAEIIELDENDSMKHVTGKEILTVNNVMEFKKPITLEEIKIDSGVDKQRKLEILNLVNEFRDCFALSLSELGCTNLIKMDIKEVENSKPICMRPYRTNAEERATIREIVSDWKKNGIVTETRSPYASPVLLVKKKTGEARLVVDYRKLNSQTIKDKFPLPRIDDLLERLSDCKFFTVLDLAHGYLQIPLTEEAKLKTAFITDEETGQFERMIFGLVNAPSEFQRLMNRVLGPLLNKEVLCYLDDILVPAKSWDQMMEKLRKIFERLREAKLTLKITKCEFAKSEVEYLGFSIKQEGLQPGMRKVRAITNFPEPTNEHGVRQFLGLASFFRRFVPKYAEIAEPLTKLTRKDEKFQWREDQQQAFDMLKKHLSNQPVLALYNPEAETEVHTDASSKGLAGMLLQKGKDKKWHLVYCVSKGTTEAEKNYHSSKLELMAIVWTLTRLRQFLIGIKFTIITDCEALVYMNAKKTTNPQIARWSNLIQEYDFNVKHRPGEKMNHVDALSRSPTEPPEETLDSIIEDNLEVCLTLTSDEQILMIQHADSELRELINILKKKASDRTDAENQKTENYVMKQNRLFRRVKEREKEKLLYVIPKPMRKAIVVKFHDLLGHFSVDRTVDKIKESYWFKGMKRYVKHHVSMCFECLMNKVPSGKKQGVLHPIKPGRRPFAVIHIDHLGPFVKSSKGNIELFVIIDNFTRFTRLYPMKSTSTRNVITAMKSFVDDFGLPERIISDRGTCFTSREFKDYCETNGIRHTLNSTQHPRANGMVERANRTILSTIKTSMKNPNQRDWDKQIRECERNLNSMINKTTDKTPFELLHGYSPKFNDGLMRLMTDEDAKEWENPVILQDEARNRIEDKQRDIKDKFDKKKSGSLKFETGEIVVMRGVPKSKGESTKTQPKYRGPLLITEVLPSDTYRVIQLDEKKGHTLNTTAHVSQLKSWRCWTDSDDDYGEDDDEDENAEENDTKNARVERPRNRKRRKKKRY